MSKFTLHSEPGNPIGGKRGQQDEAEEANDNENNNYDDINKVKFIPVVGTLFPPPDESDGEIVGEAEEVLVAVADVGRTLVAEGVADGVTVNVSNTTTVLGCPSVTMTISTGRSPRLDIFSPLSPRLSIQSKIYGRRREIEIMDGDISKRNGGISTCQDQGGELWHQWGRTETPQKPRNAFVSELKFFQ